MKVFSIAVFLFFTCLFAKAQTSSVDCSNVLTVANKAYEAGKFSECIAKLNNCIGALAKQEKYEAYRLLTFCYLNTNEDTMANAALVQLLKNKPDYREFPYFDPLEFTKLAAQYDVWAQLEIGLKTGINLNSVRIINYYSVNGLGGVYNSNLGFQIGVLGEYYFKKNMSLNLEMQYEGLGYSKTTEEPSEWQQVFTENLRYFSLPLSCKYYFVNWKGLRVSAEVGLQTQFLSKSNSTLEFTNQKTQELVQTTLVQTDQRTKVLYYGLGGLALKQKLGGGDLSLNLRYAYGFTNVVIPEKRNDNPDFVFTNQYVDSDMAFNPLYISIGYQFPLPGSYAVRRSK